MTAPPPPRNERALPPRPGYDWNPGYWQWDARGHRHVWIAGSYLPARTGYQWIPAHWQHTARGWRFQPGRWANRAGGPVRPLPPAPPPFPGPGPRPPAPPPIDGSMTPPPAPRIEPVVQRPGFVYATGYWRWDRGRYVWTTGRYVPIRPGFHWVQAHWSRDGRGRWHFQQGHWERR